MHRVLSVWLLWLSSITLTACQPERKDAGIQLPAVPATPFAVSPNMQLIAPRVQELCGKCHAVPPPASFPRGAWRHEVEQGFNFYEEAGHTSLDLPNIESVVQYFETRALDELVVPPPVSRNDKRTSFKQHVGVAAKSPAVSFLSPTMRGTDDVPFLLSCNMRSGVIREHRHSTSDPRDTVVATIAHPAHIEPVDFNGDGREELVVAELGSFRSGDHQAGAVVWLQPEGDEKHWRKTLLVSGLGRVADVQPGDFDADGDTDLLVGEFGHVRTGNIWLLENQGLSDDVPLFAKHCLDERAGCIHVPTCDINGDGRLDFVALLSQEYEQVVAYLNQGGLQFEPREVFSASDPAFGSSGIQLVDLDGDSDLDVLYTNGDTFGSAHLKPYHAIHWLENRGTFPFTQHLLANMVGVQRALAADLDGDQDQDVVAVGFMPENLVALRELSEHDSVLLLEQVAPGEFVRQSLERGQFQHAALSLSDLDRDGDIDIAVGNFVMRAGSEAPLFTLWENQLPKGSAP